MITPKYIHDCSKCKFLGTTWDNKSHETLDLYWCNKYEVRALTKIVGRYGNGHCEYSYNLPTTDLLVNIPWYRTALKLAEEQGLYIPKSNPVNA